VGPEAQNRLACERAATIYDRENDGFRLVTIMLDDGAFKIYDRCAEKEIGSEDLASLPDEVIDERITVH